MNNRFFPLTGTLALALAACSSSNSTQLLEQPLTGSQGQLALAVTLPDPARDVVHYSVTLHSPDLGCNSEPLEVLEMGADAQGLPPGLLAEGGSADRRFAAGLVALDAGSYLACAQPLQVGDLPSAVCEPTSEVFDVTTGETVGVVLISQCEGASVGVANVVSTLNSAPTITSLEASPSVFPNTCELMQLSAEVADPDGDSTNVQWEVLEEPPEAEYQFTPEGVSSSLLTETAGSYVVGLTVSDSQGGSTVTNIEVEVTPGETGCIVPEVVEPTGPVAVRLFSGGFAQNTCAVLDNGGLHCWGFGTGGLRGDGITSNSALPVLATQYDLLGMGIGAVATGSFHMCVTLDDDSVRCVGRGQGGRVGAPAASTSHLAPVTVPELGGLIPTAIAAGEAHTCVAIASGGVRCWGVGEGGALGNGSDVDSHVPVPVIGLENLVAQSLSANRRRTCVVINGAVQCWGSHFGPDGIDALEPTLIPGLDDANCLAVAVGSDFACTLLDDRSVRCWGAGEEGQLGNDSSLDSDSAVPVLGLEDFPVAQIAAGGLHACAISTAGELRCWGYNSIGRLGVGDTLNRERPTSVDSLPPIPVVEVAPTAATTCALLEDGQIYCWGSGSGGKLGNGATANSSVPSQVAPFAE